MQNRRPTCMLKILKMMPVQKLTAMEQLKKQMMSIQKITLAQAQMMSI